MFALGMEFSNFMTKNTSLNKGWTCSGLTDLQFAPHINYFICGSSVS